MKEYGIVTPVEELETYFRDYATLDESYYLPLALWTLGTYCYQSFDAYPYLVVTGIAPNSGKSRLLELIKLTGFGTQSVSKITAAAIYTAIRDAEPEGATILIDEAETLSRQSASDLRAVINSGYRNGETVKVKIGKRVETFPTYSPKCFALIGDVYDTLRSRSIHVQMRPAEARHRFAIRTASERGRLIRDVIEDEIRERRIDIDSTYETFKGLQFFGEREEEIWTPLFVLCEVLCPERKAELIRAAADMAAEKSAEPRPYSTLRDEGKKLEDHRHAMRLLRDILSVMDQRDRIKSAELLDELKMLPAAPWRKFKRVGLTFESMARMLEPYRVEPRTIRFANEQSSQAVAKGYYRGDVEEALSQAGNDVTLAASSTV